MLLACAFFRPRDPRLNQQINVPVEYSSFYENPNCRHAELGRNLLKYVWQKIANRYDMIM